MSRRWNKQDGSPGAAGDRPPDRRHPTRPVPSQANHPEPPPPAAEDPDEWVALARQRALFGGPHPLVLAIARLPVADQDLIDRFLIVMAVRGETRHARLVESLTQEAFPACQGNATLLIPRMLRLLLKAARATLGRANDPNSC